MEPKTGIRFLMTPRSREGAVVRALPEAVQKEFLRDREGSGENKRSALEGLGANRDNPIGPNWSRPPEIGFGRPAKFT